MLVSLRRVVEGEQDADDRGVAQQVAHDHLHVSKLLVTHPAGYGQKGDPAQAGSHHAKGNGPPGAAPAADRKVGHGIAFSGTLANPQEQTEVSQDGQSGPPFNMHGAKLQRVCKTTRPACVVLFLPECSRRESGAEQHPYSNEDQEHRKPGFQVAVRSGGFEFLAYHHSSGDEHQDGQQCGGRHRYPSAEVSDQGCGRLKGHNCEASFDGFFDGGGPEQAQCGRNENASTHPDEAADDPRKEGRSAQCQGVFSAKCRLIDREKHQGGHGEGKGAKHRHPDAVRGDGGQDGSRNGGRGKRKQRESEYGFPVDRAPLFECFDACIDANGQQAQKYGFIQWVARDLRQVWDEDDGASAAKHGQGNAYAE